MMIMAVVPLLVLGQDAGSDEDDDGAAPKADAAEGFAPYQTILDRLPFGPLPPNFNPDAPPGTPPGAGDSANGPTAGEEELTEDEQQIVASVRVSILNVTPSGTAAVGFTDSSVQPPVHYYMKVGEKRDVWEVKEADPAEQTVVLLKNGVEATISGGSAALACSIIPHAIYVDVILFGKPVYRSINSKISGAEEVIIAIGGVKVTIAHSEVFVILIIHFLTFSGIERNLVGKDVHVEHNKALFGIPDFRTDSGTGAWNVYKRRIRRVSFLRNA